MPSNTYPGYNWPAALITDITFPGSVDQVLGSIYRALRVYTTAGDVIVSLGGTVSTCHSVQVGERYDVLFDTVVYSGSTAVGIEALK